MKKLNLMVASLSAWALLACGESGSLAGKWVQPVPGMPQMEQGFVLEEGGKASSVNMATLAYEKWEKQGDRLILSGKSIGNHQTIVFSDTFDIEKLTPDRLVLQKGLLKLEYAREGFAESGEGASQVSGEGLVPDSRELRLFREGIRAESVNGEKSATYILFSQDSLWADLYQSGSEAAERLQRRTLPNSKYVWNVEDDDTKNLNFADGCWTVSQRGKMLFKQSSGDNNLDLGSWVEAQYEGMLPAADGPGIRYRLHVRHREHSGDGQFLLQLTYLEAENGLDAVFTYMGKRNTLRGIPDNNDATVWQFVSDNGESIFNFLYGADGQTLTLLNERFEVPESELNYSLKKVC